MTGRERRRRRAGDRRAGGAKPGRGGGKQKTSDGARRESSAGGVVFRLADARVLFLLIRDSYGNWGFPKGHLERGEPADMAALREVMEETGVRAITVLQAIDTIEWRFRFRGTLIHKDCQFFLMESGTPDTKPQRSEGITDCRWATIDEAQTMIAYENARAVLRRASEMLASRIVTDATPPSVRTR